MSHSTPVSCFHFIQASLTRLLMSLSAPTFESNIDPKYLNVLLYSVYHPLVVFLHSFWDCCHSHCTACTLFLSGRLSVHVFRIVLAISPVLSLLLPIHHPNSSKLLVLKPHSGTQHHTLQITWFLSQPPPWGGILRNRGYRRRPCGYLNDLRTSLVVSCFAIN